MKFYTSFNLYKNKMYVRGYDGSRRFSEKVPLKPYLFIESKEGDYFTLSGKTAGKIEFDSSWEARQFIEKYKDVEGFKYYGLTNFEYPFINDEFPGKIEYNPEHIKVASIDIETAFDDDGFPNPQIANKEITAISLECNNIFHVFGTKPFKHNRKDVFYYQATDEKDMLYLFLKVWKHIDPDVVTGWNCMPINTPVWGKNRIEPLFNCNNKLYDSNVVQHGPINNKKLIKINLSNGHTIETSIDHRFPIISCDKNKYTSFGFGKKENAVIHNDVSVSKMIEIFEKETIFLEMPYHENLNMDNLSFSDNALYLAGLVYTDGSLKNKNKCTDGFTVYQSDYDFLSKLDKFGITTSIIGPYKNCYSRYIKWSNLENVYELIYNKNNKKELNLYLLSSLSRRQFLIFLSGLLDGDGFISKNLFGFCDFTSNGIKSLYELLSWNGIFSYKNKNNVLRFFIKKDELSLTKDSRWKEFVPKEPSARNSSQKASQIKFKNIGKNKVVSVVSIDVTDEMVEMTDIETDTHYFIASGVRTHNCDFFDIPYLINRLQKVDMVKEELSPWNIINSRIIKDMQGEDVKIYDILGVEVLDYMVLYKKFTPNKKESYSLNYIAHEELNKEKLDYSEYKDLMHLYRDNYQLFIEYNIRDTALVSELEEKLGFIKRVFAFAYDAKVSYRDTLATVRPWDAIIHNYLMDKKIVVPPFIHKSKNQQIMGAYVKEPIPAKYNYIVSFDVASLYPSLIMGYNIGPETLLARSNGFDFNKLLTSEYNTEKFKENDACITGNGVVYTTKFQGFLSALMNQIFADRQVFRKKMIEKEKFIENIKKELNKRGLSY